MEGAAKQVATSAAEVTRASTEQSKVAASLAKSADDVRRVARQTARALEEQADAVSALADTASKQTKSIAAVRHAHAEQSTAGEQIATAVNDIRGRLRETVAASAQQAKGVALFGREMQSLSSQIAKIRNTNLSQAEAVLALNASAVDASGST